MGLESQQAKKADSISLDLAAANSSYEPILKNAPGGGTLQSPAGVSKDTQLQRDILLPELTP